MVCGVYSGFRGVLVVFWCGVVNILGKFRIFYLVLFSRKRSLSRFIEKCKCNISGAGPENFGSILITFDHPVNTHRLNPSLSRGGGPLWVSPLRPLGWVRGPGFPYTGTPTLTQKTPQTNSLKTLLPLRTVLLPVSLHLRLFSSHL